MIFHEAVFDNNSRKISRHVSELTDQIIGHTVYHGHIVNHASLKMIKRDTKTLIESAANIGGFGVLLYIILSPIALFYQKFIFTLSAISIMFKAESHGVLNEVKVGDRLLMRLFIHHFFS